MARNVDEFADDTVAPIQFGLPVLALLAATAFALSGAGSHTVWYVVRATGVVAYALITLTVVCGLLVSNRSLPSGRPRVDVYEVHRFLALLSISAAGFHAVTLLLDSYIGFSPTQILVPFTSTYRPVAVALGIMALYGATAVYLSFYLKRWIGYATWRTLHYASFAIFALASYHGILSGADTAQTWMLGIYLVAIVSVLGLLTYRIIKATDTEAPKTTAPQGRQRLEAARASAAPTRTSGSEQPYLSENVWRPPARPR